MRQSLFDVAYAKLKDAIITGDIPPQTFINEKHLCELLQLGRTPIHQAVGRLHQEHFVEVAPRKGIVISPISLREYFELDEVRMLIEPPSARLAAGRIREEGVAQLNAAVKRGRQARRKRDLRGILLSDRDFHFALADSTGNPTLAETLKQRYERALRVWFVSYAPKDIEDHGQLETDHEALVAALQDRDGKRAEAVMKEHILSSRHHTMRGIG